MKINHRLLHYLLQKPISYRSPNLTQAFFLSLTKFKTSLSNDMKDKLPNLNLQKTGKKNSKSSSQDILKIIVSLVYLSKYQMISLDIVYQFWCKSSTIMSVSSYVLNGLTKEEIKNWMEEEKATALV